MNRTKNEPIAEADTSLTDAQAHVHGPNCNHDHHHDHDHDHFPTPKPIVRGHAKIGRNDPCHCGSTKKFKKCCGN